MSKGVRTVVTAVTFMVAMAVCAVVVLDPEIDWWLLKYAVDGYFNLVRLYECGE